MKILIVGAGPTGLSAAVELAHRGIKPRIVEKRSTSSNLSRAIGILPATLARYEHIGDIKECILEEGINIKQANMFFYGKKALGLDLEKCLDSNNLMISLPQDRTEAIIENKLNKLGCEVEYGVALEELSIKDDSTIVAVFSNQEEAYFDYVIGADGAHSRVRELSKITQEGYTLPEDWHITDFYTKSNNVDAATVRKDKERLSFMMRMADKRYRMVSNSKIDLGSLPYNLELDHVYREASFKISIKQAQTYVKGNIILCGDAAHTHSPVGGRGMNLGIADAFAAVEGILNNNLENYNKQQHKKGKEVIDMTEKLRKYIFSNSVLKQMSLRVALFILSKSPKLQKKFASNMVTF